MGTKREQISVTEFNVETRENLFDLTTQCLKCVVNAK